MAVRNERVILSLQDDFSGGMARAAATTALLNRELGNLSGQELKAARSSQAFTRDVQRVGREADGAGRSIDRLSGRVGILADLLLTLGPAALPIGAVAIPAITTLTASLGFAVVAAGSAVIAFQGVGEALKKVNEAQLDPTVENLAEAKAAMEAISPVARDMVRQLDGLGGLGKQLRDAGAESLFPGLIEALDTIVERGPEVERIIRVVNAELGDIAADSAGSLASGRWGDFFHMVESEAPDALDAMADSLGNVTHGLSEIIEAFVPLNRDGMAWLVDATDGFDKWATGLKKTEGFKEFVDYVRENGPQVAETTGAVAGALVDIAVAASPLGGPALRAIEGVADAVSAIADSDFATPLLAGIAAMRVINRLAPVTAASMAMISGGAAGGAAAGRKGRAAPKVSPGLFAATLIPAIDELSEDSNLLAAISRSGEKIGEKLGTAAFGRALSREFRIMLGLEGEEIVQRKLKDVRKDLRYLIDPVYRAKIDLEDKAAKAKQREADDWIHQWGNKRAAAKTDLNDGPRARKARQADDWITAWGAKKSAATVDANAAPALDIFGRVRAQLASLDGSTATTYVNTVRTITGPQGAAVFSQNAMGDVKNRHNPEIAPGGAWRVWAEPETQGESYIPHANDGRRPRARRILEETAGILGARSVEWFAHGGSKPKETEAQKIAREHREQAKAKAEEARRRREEREAREEEKRQRQLDRQRTKDLLASDLRDETQQANLEVLDAQRRLRSARKSDRPGDEIRDARLALKSERADVRDIRSSAQSEAREKALEEQARRQEERAEHESRMFLAAIEGQERAAQGLIDAAETQKQSAESVRDGWAQAMERAGSGATAGFRSGLFGSQQHGLWTGPGGGSSGSSWMSALMGDISGLQERGGLIQMLAGQGVTGSALEALLSEGSNADISGLLGSGQAGQFAAMFAQREALQSAVSTQAGQAAYGPQFAMASAQVAALGNQILMLQSQLAAITAQRPITVHESVSAQATAAEIARLQAMAGAA